MKIRIDDDGVVLTQSLQGKGSALAVSLRVLGTQYVNYISV